MSHIPKKNLKSWGDVNSALETLGELKAHKEALECQLQPEIDRLNAELWSEVEPVEEEIKALEALIRYFVECHLADFENGKTKTLAAGSVSIRKTARLEFEDEEEAIDALLEMGLTNCVQVNYKPVKAAIKNLGKGDLVCIGAKIFDDVNITIKPLRPKE
jgi:phage host-nuclease inhibitor protein Gam